MHMLTNLYFFPISSHVPVLVANALALFGLVLIAASSGASALMKRRRPMPARSPGSARLRALSVEAVLDVVPHALRLMVGESTQH